MTSPYEAYAAILGDDLADQPRASAYIECTDECKAQHAEWEKARDAYAAKWPRYCRHCQGWGYFEYSYDPSPAGVSLSPGTMTDSDPCHKCIEEGVCPRCGKQVFDDDDWDSGEPIVCPKCGWKEAAPDAIESEPECVCYERWM